MKIKKISESLTIGIFLSTIYYLLKYAIENAEILHLPKVIGVLLAALIVLFALISSVITIFRRRKLQRTRNNLLEIHDELRSVLKLPRTISKEQLEKDAAELTCETFFQLLDKLHHHKNFFIHFRLPNFFRSDSKPPHNKIDDRFYEEINKRFVVQNIHKPLIFYSKSIAFLKLRPLTADDHVKYENASDEIVKPVRLNARYGFGGNYCLVLPMPFYDFLQDAHQPLLGYIGIIEDEHTANQMMDDLIELADLIELVYNKIKDEKLTLRIDNLLNQNRASLLKPSHHDNVSQLFAKQLSQILKHEFFAERVDLWLKGMPPKTLSAAFNLVDDKPLEFHNSAFDYSLYCAIILEEEGKTDYRCELGWITMSRNKFKFSEMEKSLLKKIETQIDNLARDIWKEHVWREIDHKVLNKAIPSLREFSKQLIIEIVKEMDAFAGILQVEKQQPVFHILEDISIGERDKSVDTLDALNKVFRDQQDPLKGAKHNDFYLYMPLSIEQKGLGSILLLSKKPYTEVHEETLKQLEAHLDNILKLYLVMEKQ
jgi:hypothetical protein